MTGGELPRIRLSAAAAALNQFCVAVHMPRWPAACTVQAGIVILVLFDVYIIDLNKIL
jgi:hypothetical protein